MEYQTIRIESRFYENFDNCLEAAALELSMSMGLSDWDLCPRWEDDDREIILIDVPLLENNGA